MDKQDRILALVWDRNSRLDTIIEYLQSIPGGKWIMSDDHSEAILEEVREQYKFIQEGLDNLREVPQKIDAMDARLMSV